MPGGELSLIPVVSRRTRQVSLAQRSRPTQRHQSRRSLLIVFWRESRNHPETTETDGSPIGKIGYPSPKGIYEGIGKSSPIRKFTREMSVPECCLYEGYATTVNAVGASPNPKRGDQSLEGDGG